jgi:hypothetical protein
MATLAVTNTFAAGTTIVAADMNENFDDVEAFINTTPGVVQKDIVDAKGDIIAATAADAVSRLAVGSNTYVLTADSTAATGLAWAAPTTGDITGLTAGTNIGITAATGPVPTVNLSDNVTLTGNLTVAGTTTNHLNVSTESGTTHAPALGDENAYILTTHGTGITVTLPQNSVQAFAIGATIYYERNGAGTLTFAAGTGATVTSKDSTLTVGDRYTSAAAIKIGTNAWSLIGNLG